MGDEMVDVCFGSFLALHSDNTRTAALERLAVVRQRCFGRQVLNDWFHRKWPFKFLEIEQIEGLQTANCGRSLFRERRAKYGLEQALRLELI